MARPLPVNPRGPRRKSTRRATYLLACPRVSPEYEFNAVHALMKPNDRTKGKIAHVAGQQPWDARAEAAVDEVRRAVADRLAFSPTIHRAAGDYHFALTVPASQLEEAKALAIAITRRLPNLWLTLGRLLITNGRFYRRQYGFKLRIIPATNVHLRRDVRAAMRGLL